MNQIADLLPAANIALDLDVPSKARLFDAFGQLFGANAGLDAGMVSASLAAREKLGSTGLGQGVAIPHGRIKGLKVARGAFARLKTAVPCAKAVPTARPAQSTATTRTRRASAPRIPRRCPIGLLAPLPAGVCRPDCQLTMRMMSL